LLLSSGKLSMVLKDQGFKVTIATMILK